MDLRHLFSVLPASAPVQLDVRHLPEDVDGIAVQLGGLSVANGLYRWHDLIRAQRWTARAGQAMPEMAGRIRCFAVDWLGRQLAVDLLRTDSAGMPMVVRVDIGSGEVVDVAANLWELHERELVHRHEEALMSSLYLDWRTASHDPFPLRAYECVGYLVPPFIGGADEVGNLTRTDTEVYWDLTGELLQKVRGDAVAATSQ